MTDDVQRTRPSALTAVLLTLRFALELALVASAVVIGVAWLDGVLGWVIGVVLAVAVAAVWGVLLSPRRQVTLGLAPRLVIELALFVAASAGLAAVGAPVWGVLLIAGELLVVAGLFLRGMPPGSDVAMG